MYYKIIIGSENSILGTNNTINFNVRLGYIV